MEERIERALDNALESIAGPFYLFSVVLGIVLVILGVILFFQKNSKKKQSISLACVSIGIIAILSGGIQMLFLD